MNLSTVGPQNTVGAGTDTISNVENVTGSSHGDTFTSGTGANSFTGGDGIDTVSYSAASSISASLGAGTASDGDSFSADREPDREPGQRHVDR